MGVRCQSSQDPIHYWRTSGRGGGGTGHCGDQALCVPDGRSPVLSSGSQRSPGDGGWVGAQPQPGLLKPHQNEEWPCARCSEGRWPVGMAFAETTGAGGPFFSPKEKPTSAPQRAGA